VTVPGPDSAQSDEVLSLVSETGRRLNERQPQITRAMSDLLAKEIDQLDEDRHLVELLEASVEGNVKTIFHVLTNNIPIEHLQPTTAAVEYALRLAQRRIPANSLVRAYHMGQDDLMQACFAEVQSLDCSPELRLEVLRHISTVVYRYIDWISLYVLEAYEKEQQRWINTIGNVHSSLIHKVISGQPLPSASFEQGTGYSLEQHHVAVVAWTARPVPEPDDLPLLERAVREMGQAAACSGPPLVTAVDGGTVWGWLPLGRRTRTLDLEAVRDVAVRGGLCRVAIGLPGHGTAGFRRSHEQAQAARGVALASPGRTPAAVSFGDPGVAIVSLLATDLDSTRRWVREVLGELAEDDPQTELLRETLHAFFALGESYSRAAEQLTVHRNTVKYRVSKVLGGGQGLGSRNRMDLALALQVCHFLGPAVLGPAEHEEPSRWRGRPG